MSDEVKISARLKGRYREIFEQVVEEAGSITGGIKLLLDIYAGEKVFMPTKPSWRYLYAIAKKLEISPEEALERILETVYVMDKLGIFVLIDPEKLGMFIGSPLLGPTGGRISGPCRSRSGSRARPRGPP